MFRDLVDKFLFCFPRRENKVSEIIWSIFAGIALIGLIDNIHVLGDVIIAFILVLGVYLISKPLFIFLLDSLKNIANLVDSILASTPGKFVLLFFIFFLVILIFSYYYWRKKMSEESKFNIKDSVIGTIVDTAQSGSHQESTLHVNQLEQKQNLAKAAAEIQQLLEQLSQTYPTSTNKEKMAVVAEAVDKIESNPTLKARIINALKAGGTEAFKEAIDHPLVNILMATLEGWQEAT